MRGIKSLAIIIMTLNTLALSALSYMCYTILTIPTVAAEHVMMPVKVGDRSDGLVLMYDEQTRQVYNMTVADKCRTK